MDYFTGIFALAIGGISIWMSLRLILLYLKVKKWDQVPSKILSKEVALHPKATTKARHILKVQYAYRYNGVELKGDKVFLVELLGGWQTFMKSAAEEKLQEVPASPKVFVNPADPQQSVVYCKANAWYVVILVMGIFSFLFGVAKMV
ncbi:MAG TPA: DUF3592 domain-containing protein [Cyclobacteriaceae bacterium]|jgi:hypothetical protein|nr:DUF3592 domain-containing protein [Cyclobacteriaceae bacterium]